MKDSCPKCKVSLVGDPIPPRLRQFYGGEKFYGRKIGIYDRRLDRTVRWRCPDCQHEWPRKIAP